MLTIKAKIALYIDFELEQYVDRSINYGTWPLQMYLLVLMSTNVAKTKNNLQLLMKISTAVKIKT